MLILDYIRNLRERPEGGAFVVIPPFHTGTLGTPPQTRVFTHLKLPDPGNRDGPCELLASPFPSALGHMFHLEVLVEDEPGVVQRVVRAVNTLGLNIAKLESTSINADRHHYIQCVLDWSTASKPSYRRHRPSRPSDRHRFATLASRIPIEDGRFIDLYIALMRRIADIVVVDRAYGRALPSILVRPFCNREFNGRESATLQPDLDGGLPPESTLGEFVEVAQPKVLGPKGRTQNVLLPISDAMLREIRERTGAGTGPVPYLLASYGLHRTLRVLFPNVSAVSSAVRIGFYHRDRPGAVLAFCELLERAGFNIWNSINRKTAQNASIFEVLAVFDSDRQGFRKAAEEAQSEGAPDPVEPEASSARSKREAEMLSWTVQIIHKTLKDAPRLLKRVSAYDTRISAPLYPRFLQLNQYWQVEASGDAPRMTLVKTSPLDQLDAMTSQAFLDPDTEQDGSVKQRGWDAIANAKMASPADPRRAFAEAVFDRSDQPRVFLSYPRNATLHASLVKDRLERNFDCKVVEYQDKDFSIIVKQATEMIVGADFFIGIWHQDRETLQSVSPWMPFEYGVATTAFTKHRSGLTEITENAIVVYSDQLPDAITQRLQAGIAQPSYSDVSFGTVTLDSIALHCEKKWRLERRADDQAQGG